MGVVKTLLIKFVSSKIKPDKVLYALLSEKEFVLTENAAGKSSTKNICAWRRMSF
jgi:hypothetical protein